MMDKFNRWWNINQIEIQWFIIGWCLSTAISDFARGDWFGVALNLSLAYINYYLNKR